MRILIDLQACQSTGSRTRGIGRYSFSLAQAMVRQAGAHDVHLLLNGAFQDSVLALRDSFHNLLPSKNIHVWNGVIPASELESNNHWRIRTSELIREQAIHELRPDILHVSSLFEGLTDDAVTSIGSSCASILSAVTLYDLIPLINATPYLENPQVRSWYYRKVQSIKRADLLLAISESSRKEGLDWLHLPDDRIVNISSAVDDRFKLQEWSAIELQVLKQRYGLTRPFILYTGGIDLRKNIEGLIQAYANLPTSLRELYQLVIVCSAQVHDRERLQKLAATCGLAKDDLVMTGFVPDEDLPKLYYACELFVFPSWHEGFGLPALEAMACGAPVIAANTSSLPEVVGRNDALFDPRNIDAMIGKIAQVLTDSAFKKSLVEHGLSQAKKFSWNTSAKIAIEALEKCHEASQARQNFASYPSIRANKPRLAYFSPIPPAQSGIADYSAELLPELATHYDIEIIVDQTDVSDSWIAANFPIRNMKWFEEHAKRFTRILYNFGNSTFHSYMLDAMKDFPGVVVLHDFYHSGLISHLDLTGQKTGIWDMALYQSHGYRALFEKSKATDCHQIIWKYPCNQMVLELADGIIVHSAFSKKLAQDWYGSNAANDWKLIQHLRVLPQKIDREKARMSLGLSDNDFLICSFGILGPTKLNHVLLNAWLNSQLAEDKTCHLVFVGKNDGGEYGVNLLKVMGASHASNRIKITGFAGIELFRTYLQAADAAVQLRGLSRGETSGTVLDCMAYGVPTIINNNGSMAELPDHALIKLPEDVDEASLIKQLETLYQQKHLREQLGCAAKEHIKKMHAPCQIGVEYRDAIEYFYAKLPSITLHKTVQQIAELEGNFPEQDLRDASKCLATNRQLVQRRRLLINCENLSQLMIQEQLHRMIPMLIKSAPDNWRIDPFMFDGEVPRLAAKQFESYLNISSYVAEHLDLDALDLCDADVLLCFAVNNQTQMLAPDVHLRLQVIGVVIKILDLSGMMNMEGKVHDLAMKNWWLQLGE